MIIILKKCRDILLYLYVYFLKLVKKGLIIEDTVIIKLEL